MTGHCAETHHCEPQAKQSPRFYFRRDAQIGRLYGVVQSAFFPADFILQYALRATQDETGTIPSYGEQLRNLYPSVVYSILNSVQ